MHRKQVLACTYMLLGWSNVEYTAARTTATRLGKTLGWGHAAPGLCMLKTKTTLIIRVSHDSTENHLPVSFKEIIIEALVKGAAE